MGYDALRSHFASKAQQGLSGFDKLDADMSYQLAPRAQLFRRDAGEMLACVCGHRPPICKWVAIAWSLASECAVTCFDLSPTCGVMNLGCGIRTYRGAEVQQGLQAIGELRCSQAPVWLGGERAATLGKGAGYVTPGEEQKGVEGVNWSCITHNARALPSQLMQGLSRTWHR